MTHLLKLVNTLFSIVEISLKQPASFPTLAPFDTFKLPGVLTLAPYQLTDLIQGCQCPLLTVQHLKRAFFIPTLLLPLAATSRLLQTNSILYKYHTSFKVCQPLVFKRGSWNRTSIAEFKVRCPNQLDDSPNHHRIPYVRA